MTTTLLVSAADHHDWKYSGTHPTLQSAGCASWRREPSQSLLCVGPPARWNAASSSWAPRDLTPGIVWARSLTSGSFPPCPQCSSAPRRWRDMHILLFSYFWKKYHNLLNVIWTETTVFVVIASQWNNYAWQSTSSFFSSLLLKIFIAKIQEPIITCTKIIQISSKTWTRHFNL